MAYLSWNSEAHLAERRVVGYFIGVLWRLEADVSDERAINAARFCEAYNACCGPSDTEEEAILKRAYNALDYMMEQAEAMDV